MLIQLNQYGSIDFESNKKFIHIRVSVNENCQFEISKMHLKNRFFLVKNWFLLLRLHNSKETDGKMAAIESAARNAVNAAIALI